MANVYKSRTNIRFMEDGVSGDDLAIAVSNAEEEFDQLKDDATTLHHSTEAIIAEENGRDSSLVILSHAVKRETYNSNNALPSTIDQLMSDTRIVSLILSGFQNIQRMIATKICAN